MDFYVKHYEEVPKEEVFEGVYIRRLVDKSAGDVKNYTMRLFEMLPGSVIPEHEHPREHEIFILEGEGIITIGDKEYHVKKGYVLFIPENVKHGYKNTGEDTMKFICVIPCKGAKDRCA